MSNDIAARLRLYAERMKETKYTGNGRLDTQDATEAT